MAVGKFKQKLSNAAGTNQSWLCIGLDPDLEKLPSGVERNLRGAEKFLRKIIDSTNKLVCAYKPNSAFYEQFGAEGIALLKKIIDYVPDGIPVILDAKRGDIGNTSRMYAAFAFDWLGADAITVSPYLGYDSVMPFIEREDSGVFLLCLTSNPSAQDLQKRPVAGQGGNSKLLYELVAELAATWNVAGNVGVVVGATKPTELGRVRQIVGEGMPILVPGIGTQGGDLQEAFVAGSNSARQLAIINASRSVLYASAGDDFAEKAVEAAVQLVALMRSLSDRNAS